MIALFLVTTALMTWPLATGMGHLLLGTPGDSLVWPWNYVWTRRALLTLHQWPFFGNFAYQPYPNAYLHHTHTFSEGFIYTLGSLVSDNPYLWRNLFIFESFTLAGYGTFLLARRVSGSTAGALVAGMAFAFSAGRLMRATAHLNILSSEWIPLYLFFLIGAWQTNRRRDWLGAGLCCVVAAWTEYYDALFILLFTALFFACVPLLRPPGRHGWRRRLLHLALPTLAAAFLLLPMVWGLWLTVKTHVILANGSLPQFNANPLAYVLPSTQHRLLGPILQPMAWRMGLTRNESEQIVFLGHVALALAIAGWFLARRRTNYQQFFFLAAVFFFLMSLGPSMNVPWGGAEHAVALPYAALLKVPFFRDFRVPARFAIMVMLCVAVLAAFGIRALMPADGLTRRNRIEVSAAIFLILLGTLQAPYRDVYDAFDPKVMPMKLLDAIREDPAEGTVLTLPLSHEDWTALRYQTIHRKPAVGGVLARPEDYARFYFDHLNMLGWFRPSREILHVYQDPARAYWLSDEHGRAGQMPRDEAAAPWTARQVRDFLALDQIRYFVLPPSDAGANLAARFKSELFPIRQTRHDGKATLYTFEDVRPEYPLTIDGGAVAANCFFVANFSDPAGGCRWLEGRRGAIAFRLDRPATMTATVQMGYPEHITTGTQRVKISINRHEVYEGALAAGWADVHVSLPASALFAGINFLQFEAGVVRSPKDAGEGLDGRELSIMFGKTVLDQPASSGAAGAGSP